MIRSDLLKSVERVDEIASASKIKRMLYNPIKYIYAILYRSIYYRFTKKSKMLYVNTFFNQKMYVRLPASTDIFLTGGKSHMAEIRLARLIINHLNPGGAFLDVGAHYGYFTLLAAKIVGMKGRVISIEASSMNYSILEKNTQKLSQIKTINKAASDAHETITFYEFPNKYAEYNSIQIEQFENESWFKKTKPRKIQVESLVLDGLVTQESLKPDIIKIDVEGAEFKVIKGLMESLKMNSPLVVMEYLHEERGNQPHKDALALLRTMNYIPYTINHNGGLTHCDNIDAYLSELKVDADNIVFKKGDPST